MKRMLWVALALALAAGTAHAAGDFKDGKKVTTTGQAIPATLVGSMSSADSLGHALRSDASGNLLISDSSRDRNCAITSLVFQDSTATGSADSTATPVYTGDMSRLWLRVQVQWPYSTDAGTNQKTVRFAVQVRMHGSTATDSLSISPWWAYTDSSHTRSFPTDSSGYRMWSDSTNWTAGGGKTAGYILLPTELGPFYATHKGVTGTPSKQIGNWWGEPTTFYIPLADARGIYYWGPYTSIRIRTLINNSNGVVKYTATLYGTALR